MNNNIYLLDIFVNYSIIENNLTHLELYLFCIDLFLFNEIK